MIAKAMKRETDYNRIVRQKIEAGYTHEHAVMIADAVVDATKDVRSIKSEHWDHSRTSHAKETKE